MEENKLTAYSSETPEGYRYRVILWSTEFSLPGGYWWVHDTLKNKFIKIGRVQLKGVNYFDRAVEFCRDKQNGE